MKFDAALPIAVFLGPSLDERSARGLLPANYYPPVRMGDIYRLSTCGTRLIVIIDGVFHGTSPVWQREIVAAINNGVTVVGAASMGALRAIELEPFGMIGLGTIVDWYRTGRIEGDDEVALQHADAEFGYRALSEPLVNIRWNLERATTAGIVTESEQRDLVGAMQVLDHGRRAYPVLFESAAFTRLAADTQSTLREFLVPGESLKRHDAETALRWCAQRLPQLVNGSAPPQPVGRRVERVDELLLRGIPAPDGSLPILKDLLVIAAADTARVMHAVHHASRRFYLRDWARHARVTPPAGVVQDYAAEWIATTGVVDRVAWCIANGMTADDLTLALEVRALESWLLAQGPRAFGLERPFLEEWAAIMGIEPPAGVEGSEPFRAWLVEKTPNYFGFDQWSVDAEYCRDLQLRGEIARLAAGDEMTAVTQERTHGVRAR
jgi:hypothetical protein